MKVLIINGSPRVNGNATIAVNEMVKIFDNEGVESEVVQIGKQRRARMYRLRKML